MEPSLERLLIAHGLDRDHAAAARRLDAVPAARVEAELARPFAPFTPARLAAFLSPAARAYLEPMAAQARRVTIQRFGRVMLLYAPLYVSNFCASYCSYCGFRAGAGVRRRRLTVAETLREAELLAREGFQHILLVAGEDPKRITTDYLCDVARGLRRSFASVAVEVHQLERDDYARLVEAGVDGITLYQETYDREVYARYHLSGGKADYARRLRVHDDAGAAGAARVAIGALLGLSRWRAEALALGLHADYLLRRYWRTSVSISFPRIRPAASQAFQPPCPVQDADLAQMILALRLCFPDVHLTLSTREPARLRDRLCLLGITQMSAGSRTNPGGYSAPEESERQFEISDERPPDEVAAFLAAHGYEAVWKDWDAALAGTEAR